MDVRSRIRKVLEDHADWSPTSVSIRAGLSNSALQKFLNPDKPGGIQSMTLDKIEAIAKALEVNPRWLIFGDSPRQPDEKIVHIWDRIPDRDKGRALAILEALTEDDPEPPTTDPAQAGDVRQVAEKRMPWRGPSVRGGKR